MMILIRNRLFHTEFIPQKTVHLPETCVIYLQQIRGHEFLPFPGIIRQPFGTQPSGKLHLLEFSSLSGPRLAQKTLVDQIHRDQDGIIFQCKPRIWIFRGKPVLCKPLPILQCGAFQEHKMFEISVAPFLKFLRRKCAGNITVRHDINAAFLETGDQPVQTVQILRVQLRACSIFSDGKSIVMMMNPYKIEPGSRNSIGKTLRPLTVKELGGVNQIGPIETYRHAGTVPELKQSVPHHHRTILPGRGVKGPGKIQNRTRNDILFLTDRLPVRIFRNQDRTAELLFRNTVRRKRRRDNRPNRCSARDKRNFADRFVFNPPNRTVQPDRCVFIFSAPGDHSVRNRLRQPPVSDIRSTGNGNHGTRSIRIFQHDLSDFPAGRPRQSMQNVKKSSLNGSRQNCFRRLREITAERSAQHDAGLVIVVPRSDQRKRNHTNPGFLFPTRQHTEIIVRPLISPTAFPVIRFIITESSCKRPAEIKRSDHIRLFPELKRNSIPVRPRFRQKKTYRERIPSTCAVILHQKVKWRWCGKYHTGTIHRNDNLFCFLPKKIERIPGLENPHRKFKLPAFRLNLPSGIFRYRRSHIKRDLPGMATAFQDNVHAETPHIRTIRRQFLPQHPFQRRRLELRFQRCAVALLHNECTIRLCRPPPLLIKTSKTDRNAADLKITFFVHLQLRGKR